MAGGTPARITPQYADGCLPSGGRARSESVSASCAMVGWALSMVLIDLPFSHWTHVTFKLQQLARVGWAGAASVDIMMTRKAVTARTLKQLTQASLLHPRANLARWVGGKFGAVRAGVADFNAESAIAQGLSNRAGFIQA
jgi:hypothetical protein